MQLGWFPIGGYGTLRQLVLPSLTLGHPRRRLVCAHDALHPCSTCCARITSAPPAPRAWRERQVVLVHALPNAMLPIVAMIGIDIGYFMSGVVVVESVFGWPGIGQLAWQAIQRIDIPIIMGVTLVAACRHRASAICSPTWSRR